MPQREVGQRGSSTLLMLIVLAVVFGLFCWVLFNPTVDRVDKIHEFLGTNSGPESSWSGLVGSMERNNRFHREQHIKIACSFWKLEHPGQPDSIPCPPGIVHSRPLSLPPYP